MPPTKIRLVAAHCELLAGVGSDRFEHPEALPCVPNQALVDERLERVQVGVRYAFGRLERAAAAEDEKPREQTLLLLVEQFVAPLDRRAERLLTGFRVAAALEQVEPLREALQDLGGREDARPSGGQLERER